MWRLVSRYYNSNYFVNECLLCSGIGALTSGTIGATQGLALNTSLFGIAGAFIGYSVVPLLPIVPIIVPTYFK